MNIIDRWLKNSPRSATAAQNADQKSRLYHYRIEAADEKSRVHLRLDPDGHGTLIVNANRVMHLNPTAALMAYLILEKKPQAEALKTVRKQ